MMAGNNMNTVLIIPQNGLNVHSQIISSQINNIDKIPLENLNFIVTQESVTEEQTIQKPLHTANDNSNSNEFYTLITGINCSEKPADNTENIQNTFILPHNDFTMQNRLLVINANNDEMLIHPSNKNNMDMEISNYSESIINGTNTHKKVSNIAPKNCKKKMHIKLVKKGSLTSNTNEKISNTVKAKYFNSNDKSMKYLNENILQSKLKENVSMKTENTESKKVSNNDKKFNERSGSKNNTLLHTSNKPRIIYRVLNPEDLNLYSPSDNHRSTLSTLRKIGPKRSLKSKTNVEHNHASLDLTSVTRSGRSVRPPRHIANNFHQKTLDNNDFIRMEFDNVNEPIQRNTVRRVTCPFCRKTYHTPKTMARHLYTFPNHAINSKSLELLEKYKAGLQVKKVSTSNIETQTDSIINQNNDEKYLKIDRSSNKKENESDPHVNKYQRDDKSLFRGFMRILQRTTPECRASVFVRQLAFLIMKLRKLLPCLLHRTQNSSPYLINEPVGKVLDLSPGKYHLNMDAISCSKIPSGMCMHIQNLNTNNVCNETPLSYNNSWINKSNEKCLENSEKDLTDCTRVNPVDNWNSNIPKSKWIPVGSARPVESSNASQENWISTSCDLINKVSFTQTNEQMKTWETTLHENNANIDNTTNASWMSNTINELSEINSSTCLISSQQNNLITGSIHSTSRNSSLNFDCKDKLVNNLHSTDIVFDIDKEIIPLDIKNNLNHKSQAQINENPVQQSFDFTNSCFNTQITSTKINFTDNQYNETKYTGDILPPFEKIETSKNIQLPVDTMNNIRSSTGKLHLSTDDTILSDDAYPITSESLDLSMDEPNQIDALNPIVDSCKNVTMNSRGNEIHCNDSSLLENEDLDLRINVSNAISANEPLLSVSESSLDGTRLNLSSNSSVLNLLDPDCLSFSELNSRSLDLQLDLFQFHHS